MKTFFKPVFSVVMVMVALLSVYFAGGPSEANASEKISGAPGYHRIVSLSPSITETLFALGLDEFVVGVTKYCSYPPTACVRKKVGGYIDPSYEAILALEPEMVVLLPEQAKVEKKLSILGIRTIKVSNRTVESILASIKTLGAAFSVENRAQELERELRERISAVRRRTAGLSRPKVSVVHSQRHGGL